MSICQKWWKNPLINPRTGRTIKKDGPTYSKLLEECGPAPESPKPKPKPHPKPEPKRESSPKPEPKTNSNHANPRMPFDKLKEIYIQIAPEVINKRTILLTYHPDKIPPVLKEEIKKNLVVSKFVGRVFDTLRASDVASKEDIKKILEKERPTLESPVRPKKVPKPKPPTKNSPKTSPKPQAKLIAKLEFTSDSSANSYSDDKEYTKHDQLEAFYKSRPELKKTKYAFVGTGYTDRVIEKKKLAKAFIENKNAIAIFKSGTSRKDDIVVNKNNYAIMSRLPSNLLNKGGFGFEIKSSNLLSYVEIACYGRFCGHCRLDSVYELTWYQVDDTIIVNIPVDTDSG